MKGDALRPEMDEGREEGREGGREGGTHKDDHTIHNSSFPSAAPLPCSSDRGRVKGGEV